MRIDFSVYKLDSDLEVIYEESRSYKDPYKFFQEDPEINKYYDKLVEIYNKAVEVYRGDVYTSLLTFIEKQKKHYPPHMIYTLWGEGYTPWGDYEEEVEDGLTLRVAVYFHPKVLEDAYDKYIKNGNK